MEQTKSLSANLSRITVVDALRGFALLGVILTHMWQHYGIFSGMETREALFPTSDTTIQWIFQNIIMGKFINIFAFLFGLSFFIQMDRASKKGVDFRKRFLWRMAILFVIGIIGNSFYSGDILSIYAVFGIFMVFLFKFKNWVLIIIASLLLIGTPRILTLSYENMKKVEQATPTENVPNQNTDKQTIQNPEKPSFFNSAKHNLTDGLKRKLVYQFGIVGRGYITFALFILGLVVGRLRFFEQVHVLKRRNIMLFSGFVIGVTALGFIMHFLPEPVSVRSIFGSLKSANITPSFYAVMALKDIQSVLFSGALAMGFIVLYQIKNIQKYLCVIVPYGQMGLTNYETQSVIGCLLFSAWGAGSIFGSWGVTVLFILGLVIYALQVASSKYWMKFYLYGPLEWFWRSATYLKKQPIRRVFP